SSGKSAFNATRCFRRAGRRWCRERLRAGRDDLLQPRSQTRSPYASGTPSNSVMGSVEPEDPPDEAEQPPGRRADATADDLDLAVFPDPDRAAPGAKKNLLFTLEHQGGRLEPDLARSPRGQGADDHRRLALRELDEHGVPDRMRVGDDIDIDL